MNLQAGQPLRGPFWRRVVQRSASFRIETPENLTIWGSLPPLVASSWTRIPKPCWGPGGEGLETGLIGIREAKAPSHKVNMWIGEAAHTSAPLTRRRRFGASAGISASRSASACCQPAAAGWESGSPADGGSFLLSSSCPKP